VPPLLLKEKGAGMRCIEEKGQGLRWFEEKGAEGWGALRRKS